MYWRLVRRLPRQRTSIQLSPAQLQTRARPYQSNELSALLGPVKMKNRDVHSGMHEKWLPRVLSSTLDLWEYLNTSCVFQCAHKQLRGFHNGARVCTYKLPKSDLCRCSKKLMNYIAIALLINNTVYVTYCCS